MNGPTEAPPRPRCRGRVAAAVALAVASGGGFVAYRAFQGTSPSGVQNAESMQHVFPGIWPESTWKQWEEADQRISAGEDPWRLDPAQTAGAFVRAVLGWKLEGLQVEIFGRQDPSGALDVAVSDPDAWHGHALELKLRRLGPAPDHAPWTVLSALGGRLDLQVPERGWDLPAGSQLPVTGSLGLYPLPHGDGPSGPVYPSVPPPGFISPDDVEVEAFLLPGMGEPLTRENALVDETLRFREGYFEGELGEIPQDPDGSLILVVQGRGPDDAILGMAALRIGTAEILDVTVFFGANPNDPTVLRGVTRWVPRTGSRISAALEELFKGPTPEERARGLTSPFSEATAGASPAVQTYFTDLWLDLDAGLASILSKEDGPAFLAQVNATVFQFPGIVQIEYLVDGGCAPPSFPLFEHCHVEVRPPDDAAELPAAVMQTRDAIFEAAARGDYDALGRLADPKRFTYSPDESGDPAAYWEQQAVDAIEILPILQHILGADHVVDEQGVYVWPSVHGKPVEEWTESETEWAYAIEDIEDDYCIFFDATGEYIGYRVGIQPDGAWIFFLGEGNSSAAC